MEVHSTERAVALVRYFCCTLSVLGISALFATQRPITLTSIVLLITVAAGVAACAEAPYVVNSLSGSSFVDSAELREWLVQFGSIMHQLATGCIRLAKAAFGFFLPST